MTPRHILKTWTLFLLTLVALGANAQSETDSDSAAADGDAPLQMGIVLDVEDPQIANYARELVSQIQQLAVDVRPVAIDDAHIVASDGTAANVLENLNGLLANEEVDLVLAFGVIASDQAVRLTEVSKPLIAPFILDPILQKAPLTSNGTSGVANLNYLLNAPSFVDSMDAFLDAVGPSEVTVITDALMGGIPTAEQEGTLKALLKNEPVTITVLPYEGEGTAQKIPESSRGVFVFPLFSKPMSERKALFQALSDSGKRVFAWRGLRDVENGALISFTDKVDLPRLNRRIAITVSKMLEQPDANLADTEVGFVEGGKLSINMPVAQAVGFQPSRSVLVSANLIGAEGLEQSSKLTLQQAVAEALEKNLAYLATQAGVEAGKQDFWKAWTRYFPQLFARGGYTLLDEDTATAVALNQSQHTLNGEIGFMQTILDARAIADIAIQGALNDGRDATLEQAKLDIALTAASAYLAVQVAKANVKIYRANLEVTEYNLTMAQRKNTVGLAGPAEVYRWESEQASDLQKIIVEETRLESARFTLNRVLHREIHEVIDTDDKDLLGEGGYEPDKRWAALFDDAAKFEQFKLYMAQIGLDSAPELKKYDATIRAKHKERRSQIAGFLVPSLALTGTVGNRFWEQSADGAADNALPEGYGTLAATLNWNIFEGGAKIASHKKARMEAAQLTYEREDQAYALREHIYKSITNIVGSAASVRLSTIASEAAHKNLDIATEAYGLGTIPLERLVDAQRQAFNADQALANAQFQLKLDELNVMRAINKLEVYIESGNPKDQLLDDFEESLKK